MAVHDQPHPEQLESDCCFGGGMHIVEKNKDGTTTDIHFDKLDKPRRISCTFTRGKIRGAFTAILLGSADSTSLECTLDVEGLGLFAKPQKKLEAYLETLRKVLGD